MKAWQVEIMNRDLDRKYEAESEKMWAAANADNEWDRKLEAVGYMNVALENFDTMLNRLIDAQDQVAGLDAEYRVGQLISDFEDLGCDLRRLRKQFIEGR